MGTFSTSKSLSHGDDSAAEFVIEMLNGDPTFAVNFDRIQWDNKNNCYVIIEYLLCDESQFARGVTPHTSHPNRYFHKNARKFLALWQIAADLRAILYLVNYAKKGTEFQNQVLLMKVEMINADLATPVKTIDRKITRSQYSAWFRELNIRGKR